MLKPWAPLRTIVSLVSALVCNLAEWMSKNLQLLIKNSPKVRLGDYLYPPPNTSHKIAENE